MVNEARDIFLKLMLTISILIALVFSGVSELQMQGSHEVAILVVDDFTGGEPDVSDLAAEDSCAVSFEEQAFAVRGAAAGDTGELTHGDLVSAQLEAMLDDAGVSASIPLVKVDIHGLSAEEVAEAVQIAVVDNPADVYIANMSFALIPCEYVKAFIDLQVDMLEAKELRDGNRSRSLLQRAVVFYDGTVFPANSNRAQEMEDLNPLQTYLAEQGALIVPVAAAGNYGLDFPFWPGAWSEVVSVSASEGQGFYPAGPWSKSDDTPLLGAVAGQRGQRTRISNLGEVLLPGVFASEAGDISGTSFAAPRLTVTLALYAAQVGLDYCQNDDGTIALAYGDWDNLTLEEVAQDHCPGLEQYLP